MEARWEPAENSAEGGNLRFSERTELMDSWLVDGFSSVAIDPVFMS
jgi:hypothetical protein